MPRSKQLSFRDSLHAYLRLLSYVKPYYPIFFLSITGYILFALSQPAFAKLIEYFVKGLESHSNHLLFYVPLATVAIALVRGVGSFLGSYFLARVAQNVVHDLRIAMFNKLLELPCAYLDHHSSGRLLSKITYNVTMVTGAATETVQILVREGFTIVFLLGFLLWTNFKLTLIFLAISPVIALIVNSVSKKLRKLSHKIQNAMGTITHIATESIRGYRVVKSFGGEQYEKLRFLEASKKNLHQAMKMVRVSAATTPLLQSIIISALAVIMFLVLYMKDSAAPAVLISFVTAAGLLPKPMRQISEVYSEIQKGVAAAQSIFEHLDLSVETDQGAVNEHKIQGDILFKEVTFHYPKNHKAALNSVSFHIKPGETIALVGQSGSGKSTIANLISRFYNVSSGSILIDGIPIESYRLTTLRKHIALVEQNTTLFNDTIARNIAYGELQAHSEEAISSAAQAAYAMEYIKDLPEGLHTLTGENGVLLSGGQRQRLAIARALLKNAPILVLDEATSALDTKSEKVIQEALQTVMQHRTTLVIAHRLSTIQNADRIFFIDKGRIIETGTHEELLAQGGAYAQLYRIQFERQTRIL